MASPGDKPDTMESVEVLAQAARKGDRRAFERLARECQPAVWRYALSVVQDRELADEIAQETWARAVRSIKRFRGDSAVTTWLIAIERRVIADVLEASRKRPPLRADDDQVVMASVEFPAVSVEVGVLLNDLPPEMRDAIVLTQVVGLPYEEAARALGVKTGTVKSRVFRARELLVDAYSEKPPSREAEKAT